MRAARRRRGRFELRAGGRVDVARDEHGIPHIKAATVGDALFGLGYCHGSDRAVQMTLVRVLGQGRACELLRDDDELLAFDRLFRRLDLGAGARAEIDKLSSEHRALVEAYSRGVNRALERRRPFEFRLLRFRPEPWTPADCVLLFRVIGYFGLAQTQGDMERFILEMLHGGVPLPLLDELFGPALGGADEDTLRGVRLGARLIPGHLRWAASLPSAAASNCWAIAPRHSASGAALLASDPHLEVNRLPPLWYEAAIELPERFCVGATMPGLPAFVVARTDDVAWGLTYSCLDGHDSWVEDCRDGCYRRVETSGERWVPFRARTETIRRRRRDDVTVTFYENDHGVLDGDPHEPGLCLTSRWAAAAGTGARSIASALDLLWAPDVRRAMDLLGRVETSWTWVLADRHGHIGLQMSGLLPVRRSAANGVLPAEGWDPANDWVGFAAPEDLPRTIDPPEGYVVSANHDINHLGRARPITLPMGPQRAERIADELAVSTDWTVARCGALQMDVFSKQAHAFMAVLRPLLPDTVEGETLREWDCRYDPESRGAYLFERFYARLLAEVFGSVCGLDVARFLVEETGVVAGFYDSLDRVLLDDHSRWYGGASRDAVFRKVASEALRDAPDTTWGEHQRFTMTNVVFGGKLPRWLGFDAGPFALRGTRCTVHQGQIFSTGGRRVAVAASYRLVADLGERAAHTALPGGPTEGRWSRWYTSGIAGWLSGRLKRVTPGT